MTPEIYAIRFALTVLMGLLGVIWKQLNARLDRKDKADEQSLLTLKASLKEDFATVTASINSRIQETSQRLSSGSLRMDGLQKEISDHKVKIAEQYHSAEETRTLIADLIRPLEMMMNGLRTDVVTALTGRKPQ